MNYYDTIFVTNLPSFYKLSLYNRIAEKKKIMVIFTGDTALLRDKDFFDGSYAFEYFYLSHNTDLKRALAACKIVKACTYKELVIGGWDSLVMWFLLFISDKEINSQIIESSYLESTTKGFKGFLKKLFLSRISKVYVPGKSNEKLVKDLGYSGQIVKTGGVGLFNIVSQPIYTKKEKVENFLYVGRLSEEKNLFSIIQVFNNLPNIRLNIVGYGPLEAKLKALAMPNICFYGAVKNRNLFSVYQSNDVLILPSFSEPWGLVVEEALNNGIPVIVSDKVGCAEEIVNESNGIIYSIGDPVGLKNAILKMKNVAYYNELRENISKYDFEEIVENQINCYL